MRCLMDTNILLRWVQPDHELNQLVHAAVDALRDRDDDVFVAPQNLVEFRCVATRPRDVNGLGMDPGQADTELRTLEALFVIASDDPRVYEEWCRLVANLKVSGVKVHDARLVAAMHIHGLSHVLTLNPSDFTRYPSITALHPQEVIGTP